MPGSCNSEKGTPPSPYPPSNARCPVHFCQNDQIISIRPGRTRTAGAVLPMRASRTASKSRPMQICNHQQGRFRVACAAASRGSNVTLKEQQFDDARTQRRQGMQGCKFFVVIQSCQSSLAASDSWLQIPKELYISRKPHVHKEEGLAGQKLPRSAINMASWLHHQLPGVSARGLQCARAPRRRPLWRGHPPSWFAQGSEASARPASRPGDVVHGTAPCDIGIGEPYCGPCWMCLQPVSPVSGGQRGMRPTWAVGGNGPTGHLALAKRDGNTAPKLMWSSARLSYVRDAVLRLGCCTPSAVAVPKRRRCHVVVDNGCSIFAPSADPMPPCRLQRLSTGSHGSAAERAPRGRRQQRHSHDTHDAAPDGLVGASSHVSSRADAA